MERAAAQRGQSLDKLAPAEWERLWAEAKASGAAAPGDSPE
jgi:hypothetical protein